MDQLGDVQQQEYQIFAEQVSGHSIMLKLQNSGLIAKSTSDKNINEQIFYKWIANKPNYDQFIPKYYGEISLQVDHLNTSLSDNSKQKQWLAELFKKRFNSNHKNLTYSFECPRIIDIKLGFKSNKPTKIPKYVNSTSSQLGFRINGMKVQRSQSNQDFYDKYWGRNLDQQELIQGLQLYFMHDNKKEILQQVQQRLCQLVEFIENECQQVRSWDSCSILIVYGDKETMVNLIDFQNVYIDAEQQVCDENIVVAVRSLQSILKSL